MLQRTEIYIYGFLHLVFIFLPLEHVYPTLFL